MIIMNLLESLYYIVCSSNLAVMMPDVWLVMCSSLLGISAHGVYPLLLCKFRTLLFLVKIQIAIFKDPHQIPIHPTKANYKSPWSILVPCFPSRPQWLCGISSASAFGPMTSTQTSPPSRNSLADMGRMRTATQTWTMAYEVSLEAWDGGLALFKGKIHGSTWNIIEYPHQRRQQVTFHCHVCQRVLFEHNLRPCSTPNLLGYLIFIVSIHRLWLVPKES